jgi:hypothetical protein
VACSYSHLISYTPKQGRTLSPENGLLKDGTPISRTAGRFEKTGEYLCDIPITFFYYFGGVWAENAGTMKCLDTPNNYATIHDYILMLKQSDLA